MMNRNENKKSAVILSPAVPVRQGACDAAAKPISSTSAEFVVSDGAKTKPHQALKRSLRPLAFGSSLKMTLLAFSLLLSLNLSTSYAGECLPGECPSDFTTCACNDNGKLIGATLDDDGEYYKTVVTFDGADHFTSVTEYYSADAFANDRPDVKYVLTYDGAGRTTSQTDYYGADAIANDRPSYRIVNTYDGAGNRIYSINSYFDDPTRNISDYYDANDHHHNCYYEDCSFLENTPIACAFGYIEGCVAGEVTLADGSKVMMKNGEVFDGNEVDESSCYAQGKVFWDNACVDEYPFAKKHWTPAEAAQYLKDTDNSIIMTFKVNR